MSHLAHVVDLKKSLTAAGVLCPIEQGHLTNEPYIRALLAYASKRGDVKALDDNQVWGQLEKWNNVSPINGRFIHTAALTRMNKLKGTMMTSGTIPCWKEFTLISESGVNVAELPEFGVLVIYLINELEGRHE